MDYLSFLTLRLERCPGRPELDGQDYIVLNSPASLSHLGRPKGPADKFSLKHILQHLEELLGVEVQFANDCMGEEAAVKAAALQPVSYTHLFLVYTLLTVTVI